MSIHCDNQATIVRVKNKMERVGISKPQISQVESDIIAAVISKVNIVVHNKNWVIDSGATRHICADRGAFSSYSSVDDG